MVLESIFSAKEIKSKPIDMLLLSIITAIISLVVSHIIFPEYAGIIFPLLIAVCMAPVVINIFKSEEEEDRECAEGLLKMGFFKRHDDAILLFSLFFIGVFIVVFAFGVILPNDLLATMFKPQLDSITGIRSVSGAVLSNDITSVIIVNNLKVMLFSFVLSFIFGTGALFILGWNASVLGIFLANFLKQGDILQLINTTGQIIPHAPIEILAYFLAGLAGGMLSAGLLRESLKSKEFRFIFKDSLMMLALAIASVVIGAFVEIYI